MASGSTYTNDIAGLREQILDNVSVAFSHFYKGYAPVKDVSFKIIVYAQTTGSPTYYRADVMWGDLDKPFLMGAAEPSPTKALTGLLILSAQTLTSLKDEGKVADMCYEMGVQKTRVGGVLVTEPSEVTGAEYGTRTFG